LSELPAQLGSWRGEEGIAGAIPVVAIPGSDRLERTYSSPSRFDASVLVLYVADQSGTHELVGYQTTPLVQGAPVWVGSRESGKARIRRSETREEGYSIVTFAWYDIDGHVTSSPWDAKFRTAWNVLARGRSNGALVAIRAKYAADEASAREPELRAFVTQMLDSLRSALPKGDFVSA